MAVVCSYIAVPYRKHRGTRLLCRRKKYLRKLLPLLRLPLVSLLLLFLLYLSAVTAAVVVEVAAVLFNAYPATVQE
jgi:hypothetical protein